MANPLRLGIFSQLQQASDRQRGRKEHDTALQQALQDRQRKQSLEDVMQQRAGEQYDYTKSQRPLEEALKRAQVGGLQAKAAAAGVPKRPKPTEFNNKAAFMLEGAKHASGVLDNYQAPASSIVRKIPFAGNYGLSANDQLAQQAAETLADAYLRLTTGATITPQEVKNTASQMVPTPGDKPETLRAKAARRQEVLRALHRAAAPALGGSSEDQPEGADDNLPYPNY